MDHLVARKGVGEVKNRYRNILVAVDGSEQSEKAFQEALQLAVDYQSNLFITQISNDVEPHHKGLGLSDKQQALFDRKLAKKIAEAKAFGVKTTRPIIRSGDPKKQLAKLIPEEFEIDVIMMGATSQDVISRMLVGSTAGYVVAHAPCTVVVVK